jgi:ubiquitin C-terminal hydrolase
MSENFKTHLSKRCQVAVKRAVDSGIIIKPKNCEKCNKEYKILHGHHEDYSKRLEVIWLCPACHKKQHSKKNKEPSDNPNTIPDLLVFMNKIKLLVRLERLIDENNFDKSLSLAIDKIMSEIENA